MTSMTKKLLYEIRWQFRRPVSWGVMALIILVALANETGVFARFFSSRWYVQTQSTGMDAYLFYPLCNSLIPAGLAVSLFVLLELDRAESRGMRAVLNSMIDPGEWYLYRTIALLCVVTAACLAGAAALYPVSKYALSSVLTLGQYWACWFYIYYLGLIIFTLIAAGVYLAAKNVLAGFAVIAVFALMFSNTAIMTWGKQATLLQWIQTPVNSLSDGSGNALAFRIIIYYRVFWLLFAGLAYALGQCLILRHGVTPQEVSLPKPAAAVALVLLAVLLTICFNNERYMTRVGLDDSAYVDEKSGILVERNHWESMKDVTLSRGGTVRAVLDGKTGSLKVDGTFDLTGLESTTAVFQLSTGMEVKSVTIDNKPAEYAISRYDYGTQLFGYINIPKGDFQLKLNYEGIPTNCTPSEPSSYSIMRSNNYTTNSAGLTHNRYISAYNNLAK